MPDRAALLIAVETFFEAAPPVPYATADLADLRAALPADGYRKDRCIALAANRTTKAVVESTLRRLPKLVAGAPSLLVVVASRGFAYKGRGFVACADTLPADLADTSLAVADLVAALQRTKCPEIVIALDVDPLKPAGEFAPTAVTPGLDAAELEKLFAASPSCVGLLSAEPGERSYESAQHKRGVWRHHLLEAFAGKARSAVGKGGVMTAAGLQTFLEDAVPRTVRRAYEAPATQTPILFGEGNAAAVVAELAPAAAAAGSELLDPARLRRVVFRAESTGRVKDLAGFRKTNKVPDRADEWTRKYVARLAAPDVKADLDQTFDAVREVFAYKRKDIDVGAERDGSGFVRTPDFEYTVTAAVNPDDPSEVLWRREVGQLADAGFVRGEGFTSIFGGTFDKLVFEFAVPVDVAAFVDRVEDSPPDGVSVAVGSDADDCAIKLAGFAGKVTVSRGALVVEGRAGSSAGLLDQFLAFLQKFAGLGEPKALPPA